jgi:capsular exopolysaccharide synthesis family protein
MEPAADTELDLRAYLHVLRRRRWTVVLVTLAVVVAGVGLSLSQTPIYQARADVLVDQQPNTQVDSQSSGQRLDAARTIANEVRFLQSRSVLDPLEEELGFNPTVSVSTSSTADVITIKGSNTDADKARQIAQAYADTYLALRSQRAVDAYLNTQQIVQAKISDLQAEIDDAANRIRDLDTQLLTARPADKSSLDEQRRQAVADRTSLESQQSFYRERLNQIGVTAQLLGSQGAQIISNAETPTSPISPKPLRNGALALILGLILGVGLAFLREYLDDTVASKEDVERAVGQPVVAVVPSVRRWKDSESAYLVSRVEPMSSTAEAYRGLRTSVQFLGIDRPVRVMQITSPVSTEGKTTTLANLAVAFARSGQDVVVVCCDLRRPRLHQFFGLSNEIGFTSVLLGQVKLADALQEVPGEPRLRVLSSGPHPPNPSELLGSTRTAELLAELSASSDIVLVDCPPVLPVTDSLVLSRLVDATLLVARADVTRLDDLTRAAELLGQVRAPLVGVVLNGVANRRGYGDGYGYGYHEYTEQTAKHRGRTSRGVERRRAKRLVRDAANAPLPAAPAPMPMPAASSDSADV